jgi:hypothetical protein
MSAGDKGADVVDKAGKEAETISFVDRAESNTTRKMLSRRMAGPALFFAA